jgi:1,4-dihydroxy-2-naphthoate octaprenyltransferase
MAGNELDPQRARAARDVVRQHPAMALMAVSPVLIGVGLVWWLVNPFVAILLLIGATVIGGRAVLRKR